MRFSVYSLKNFGEILLTVSKFVLIVCAKEFLHWHLPYLNTSAPSGYRGILKGNHFVAVLCSKTLYKVEIHAYT